MSQLTHLQALKEKHRDLDKQCSLGYSNYLNDSDLNKMKMEKAHVKAQIQQIEQEIDIKSES
mgnify:CR=1 FL=1|jgi:hypothetical protein